MSEIVDEYIPYTNVSGTWVSFIGQTPVSDGRHQHQSPRSIHRDGVKGPSHNQTSAINTFLRKCHICGSKCHLKGACDKVTEKEKWSAKPANATTVAYSSRRAHSPGEQSVAPPVTINRVELDNRPTAASVYDAIGVDVRTGQQSADASRPTATTVTNANSTCNVPVIHHSPICIDNNADFLDVGIESLVSLSDECEAPVNESVDYNNVHVTNVQFDMDIFIAHSNVSFHYVNLIVSDDNGTSVEVDSLFDSGTPLSVRKELIEPLQHDVLGEVKLLGFNGNMSTGNVISLNARMKEYDVSIPIRFVVCQHVTQNCFLSSLADYRKLMQTQEVRSITGQTEAGSY